MNKHLLFTIFILLSLNDVKSQSLMTVQEIYNYNIGDVFIRKEGLGYYYPPTYRKIIITNKFLSSGSDTLFYNFDSYAYTPPCSPTCPAIYDTVYGSLMQYTNLGDTIGAGLGEPPHFWDPLCIDTAGFTGIWLDSIYYNTSFCSIRTVNISVMDNVPLVDSCHICFEPFFGFDEYAEGIGMKQHYYNNCSMGFQFCEEGMQLLYYKKGLDSCGIAPIIPLPIGINELEFSPFTIYPNPFSFQTKLVFFEMQNNSSITLSNILGEAVYKTNFSGKELTLEKGELKPGIYFLRVNDRKIVHSTKLIVQ